MISMKNRIQLSLLITAGVMILLSLATVATAEWNTGYYNSGSNTDLIVIQDDEGGKFMVWTDESGASSQVMAQKLDSHGRELWAGDGIDVYGTNASFSQTNPTAISDGNGGLLICWEDERLSDNTVFIYSTRIDGNGQRLWTDGGLRGTLVCNATGNHLNPVMAPDGLGGFYVAFQDNRSGGLGVYAQYMNASGNRVWDSLGLEIRTSPTTCSNIGITTLPGGGAALVWREAIETSNQLVYVQAISQAGEIQWAQDGVRVLSYSRYHTQPKIADCGNGSLIVASGADLGYDISMEVTRLNLVTGESLWPSYQSHNTNVGYVIDFELAPARDGGAYLAMIQDTDGPGGNNTEMTMARVAPHAEWRGNYTEFGEFDDIIIGEIKPDFLAMAWSDPNNESISCQGVTFENPNNVEQTWVIEEFGMPAIQVPIAGQVGFKKGFMVGWTDAGDIAATFIDFNGIEEHYFPHVATLTDIPDDQGGWLGMNWESSSLEQSSGSSIAQYSLWLRPGGLDPAKAAAPSEDKIAKAAANSGADQEQAAALLSAGWSFLSVVPALGQASYNALVPSTADQSETGDPFTLYMVIAHTPGNTDLYYSEPAAGLSLDNLAPGAPSGLAGEFAGAGVNLQWNAVADYADDLAGYRVYGSPVQGVEPSPETLLGEVHSPDFVDESASGTTYYVVTAKDAHGNESQPSSEAEVASNTSSVGMIPDVFHLSEVYPNPFNPNTAFKFQLPTGSYVDVDIMDVRGSRVKNLLSGILSGGSHEMNWNGRDEAGRVVTSGVYFGRVRTIFGVQTVKMTLVK